MRYMQITEEDRELLHYNPNTDDVIEWAQEYARKVTELNTSDLMSDVLFFARMLDGAFDMARMADEGNDEQKAAVAMVHKYLQPNISVEPPRLAVGFMHGLGSDFSFIRKERNVRIYDTPETEEELVSEETRKEILDSSNAVHVSFARRLERERNKERCEVVRLRAALERADSVRAQPAMPVRDGREGVTPRERLEQECGGSLFLPDFDPIVVAAENALWKLQRECDAETLRAEQAVHWIGIVGSETMSGGDRDTTLAAIRALVKLRMCVERILHPDNASVTSAAILRAELGATIINAVSQPNTPVERP